MNDHERELLDCFRRATCESFSHEQHLQVAWLLLREHSLAESIGIFAAGAFALATSRGHSEFYHETVTWAYMILVNQRMHADPKANFAQFRAKNSDLFESGKEVLRKHYHPDTLESDLAKRIFLLPDAFGG